MGGTQRTGTGMGGSILGGGGGGLRPMTARGGFPGGGGARGSPSPAAAHRPASAPRERAAPNYTAAGWAKAKGGSPADARARVEETRQVNEAQFWGREVGLVLAQRALGAATGFAAACCCGSDARLQRAWHARITWGQMSSHSKTSLCARSDGVFVAHAPQSHPPLPPVPLHAGRCTIPTRSACHTHPAPCVPPPRLPPGPRSFKSPRLP